MRESFPIRLRIVVTICMAACLIILSIFSYSLMWNTEDTMFRDNFSSSSRKLSDQMISLIHTVMQDGHTVSNFQSAYYPHASEWPYAYINGFISVTEKLKAASTTFGGAYVLPIVYPENVSTFENYMKKMYAEDKSIPNDAAMHDFGFGISASNLTNGEIYHDIGGDGSVSGRGTGKNAFLAPIAAYVDQYDQDHYLRSVYTDLPMVTKGIDGVYSCLQDGNTSCQAILEPDSTGPLPGTIIVTPIMPRNDPNDTVGFVVTSFTWTVLLEEGVTILSNDMFMVFSTSDSDQFTARFVNGNVLVEGRGDLHDREYDMVSSSSSFTLLDTQAAVSVTYLIDIYPTKEFYDKFHTTVPMITTIFTAVMILSTAMLMTVYDRFMKQDTVTKRLLLEGKRQFVRFVSHEIRAPLNAAMLGLQLMNDRVRDQLGNVPVHSAASKIMSEVRDQSEDVRLNADVALVVLNELLQYDKIEVGNLQLEVGVVEIWRLMLDNIFMFNAQMQHAGIRLDVVHPLMDATASDGHKSFINSLFVTGDGIRIAQAIRSLVSIALECSLRNDPLKVTVEWHEHNLPAAVIPTLPEDHFAAHTPVFRRGSIVFSVTDHGPGMSPEDVETLFREGGQFQTSLQQSGSGSGLGLLISKGIIDMHGGKIWAYSDGPGHGSTFCIELPLCAHVEGPPAAVMSMEDFEITSQSTLATLSAAVRKQVVVRKPLGRKSRRHRRSMKYSRVNRLDSVGVEEGEEGEEDEEEEEEKEEMKEEGPWNVRASIDMFKGWVPSWRSSSCSEGLLGSHGEHDSATFGGEAYMYAKSISILIVEDDASNRDLLAQVLERRGYYCDLAVDGEHCLEILADNHTEYDVILMDYVMPKVRRGCISFSIYTNFSPLTNYTIPSLLLNWLFVDDGSTSYSDHQSKVWRRTYYPWSYR